MDSDFDEKRTEHKPCKCFRCGSVDHLIDNCPKSPKDIKKGHKQVCFNESVNSVSQKECENGDNDNYQMIYSSMAWMSGNDKNPSRDFGDSSQLNKWDFTIRSNISYDTTDFGFCARIIRRYRNIYWSCEWTSRHGEVKGRVQKKRAMIKEVFF